MKKYYVVNGTLSFGFGGFIKKAYTTEKEAQMMVQELQKKYRNLTECEISVVEAKSKKDAESDAPSLFSGEFKGIDRV